MGELQTVNNILSQFRTQYGMQATYNGHVYAITNKEVPPVRAGSFLHGDLSPFVVSSDPRVFSFNYADFATYSDTPPIFNSEITFHGSVYIVTRIETEQVNSADTLAYRAYGYCMLNAESAGVFLTDTFSFYTPKSMAAQTDSTTKNVKDISYNTESPIQAMLNPISSTEKALYFGQSDIRGCNAYTLINIPLGAYLVNQSTDEAWEVYTPSESYPATGLKIAVVRHRDVKPAGIS
jgi:hypothetical protein